MPAIQRIILVGVLLCSRVTAEIFPELHFVLGKLESNFRNSLSIRVESETVGHRETNRGESLWGESPGCVLSGFRFFAGLTHINYEHKVRNSHG